MSSEWVELICGHKPPSLISLSCWTTIAAAAWIRAVHCCKCTRSAQCPPSSLQLRLLLQQRQGWCVLTCQAPTGKASAAAVQQVGRGRLACQAFPPRPPHWSGRPVRLLVVVAVTSALLGSAKISAHSVCRMQGPTGLNLTSDISCQNIHINQSIVNAASYLCLTFSKQNVDEVGKEGGVPGQGQLCENGAAQLDCLQHHSTPLCYSASLHHCSTVQSCVTVLYTE